MLTFNIVVNNEKYCWPVVLKNPLVVCHRLDITWIKFPPPLLRLGPAQDVPYALILWYVSKTIYLS